MARRLLRKAALPALALTMLALPIAVSGAGPAWEQLGDVPNPERQEVSYVGLGGYTYLAAGNHTDHQRFNPATSTWANVARLPDSFSGVDHVQGVAVGGRIVYVGGVQTWDPPDVASAVAIYTPPTSAAPLGSFAVGEAMPRPRGAGGVAVHDGKVIYAGGLTEDGGAVAWVDEYDPIQNQWRQLEDMPRPRDHFGSAVVGGKLYAIGGRNTTIGGSGNFDVQSPYAEVDVLDLASGTWEAHVTNIPTPRGGHGVAAIGSCIYAIGGEGVASDPNGVTGVTESYNAATGEWTSLASLLTPRHGIQAAVVGQTIHIAAGGSVEEDYVPVTAHESLNVGNVAECSDGGPGGGDPGGGDPGGGNPGGGDPGSADPSGGAPSGNAPAAAPQPPGSSGGGANPPSTPAVTAKLKSLSVSPGRLRLTGRRRGTTVRFVLSKATTVRFVIQRARIRGWRRVGSLRRRGAAGVNAFRFRGRIGGRPLRRGRHRLVARVASSDDRPLRRAFRVVR